MRRITPADVLYFGPYGTKEWLFWNSELSMWEPPAQAKWYECGEPLANRENRLCTKFIGHGDEHGKRMAGPTLPNRDAGSDGIGTSSTRVDSVR